jgi:hypothetical protein
LSQHTLTTRKIFPEIGKEPKDEQKKKTVPDTVHLKPSLHSRIINH